MAIIRPNLVKGKGGKASMVMRTPMLKKGKGGGKAGGGCKWCAQGQCWSHQCAKGGGKGGKGGKGGGGGQWLFVPSNPRVPQFGAKGGGKGKLASSKTMDKLGKIEKEKKVWLGGLAKKVTWKQLEKHVVETTGSKPKITEIMSKGKGCLAFATEDDAQTVIATLNGSELEGSTIEADVWTEKEKKEGSEKPKREPKKKFGAAFVKGKGEKVNTDGVDAASKVWVGGLSPKCNANKLKKHFVENGCEVDLTRLMKSGTACVTFKSEDDASNAIAAINGTEFDGQTLEVDVWTKIDKAERRAKKAKAE